MQVDHDGAEIAVIGGSGFYDFLEDCVEVHVDTPYGPPSDSILLGAVAGRRVAFLPRHARGHRYPPHKIPYRANLWALRSLGVRQVVAPCAAGGLRPELDAGSLLVPDQLVDRTSGRSQTYHDSGVVHVSFADPYCPRGRACVVDTARARGWRVTDGGSMVVVEGPRFSTRAESRWFGAMGWDVVNMTGHPEAVLARELALCYTTMALVTDLDAGVEGAGAVTQSEVFAVFAENIGRLKALVSEAVGALSTSRDCPCGAALDGMTLDLALP